MKDTNTKETVMEAKHKNKFWYTQFCIHHITRKKLFVKLYFFITGIALSFHL